MARPKKTVSKRKSPARKGSKSPRKSAKKSKSKSPSRSYRKSARSSPARKTRKFTDTGTGPLEKRTVKQLRARSAELSIRGRSKMRKAGLVTAIRHAEGQ